MQKRALKHIREVTLGNSNETDNSESFAKALKTMQESSRKINQRQEEKKKKKKKNVETQHL